MRNHEIDLDAYLKRIGAPAAASPDLRTLRQVVSAHVSTIPFENCSVLLGWPVPLDLHSLQQKLVLSRRGGYCFEQNALLQAALGQIGFRVTGLGARILLTSESPADITPRTHMLLRVEVDADTYLADVGCGGLTPSLPLRFEPGIVQHTPHGAYRLIEVGEEYRLETAIADEWKPLYRFDLCPQFPPDYEVANWYVSTHPSSHFLRTLIAARATTEALYTLRNAVLTTRSGSRVQRRVLSSREELNATLQTVFGIHLPGSWEWDEVLDSAIASSRAEVSV